VFDSDDAAAVRAEAVKHGITFPVVITSDKNWEQYFKVGGVSRTIYFAKADSSVTWAGTGLDEKNLAALEAEVRANVKK
jgi:hypothetical protein